ncbi:MAG: hypothetical protein ABSA76_06405 [Bacteroidales bacterium]
MKEEILKKLLEKYYNGDTSLEEEQSLKEYFSGKDIMPGYEAEKEIFRLFSSSGEVPAAGDELETRIKNAIDHLEESHPVRTPSIRRYAFASLAAGLLILAASYFMLRHHAEPKDTFSDPRLAYAETMKILNEVSLKLNKGTDALEPVRKIARAAQSGLGTVSKSASVITENLKPIRMINRISNVNLDSTNKK